MYKSADNDAHNMVVPGSQVHYMDKKLTCQTVWRILDSNCFFCMYVYNSIGNSWLAKCKYNLPCCAKQN